MDDLDLLSSLRQLMDVDFDCAVLLIDSLYRRQPVENSDLHRIMPAVAEDLRKAAEDVRPAEDVREAATQEEGWATFELESEEEELEPEEKKEESFEFPTPDCGEFPTPRAFGGSAERNDIDKLDDELDCEVFRFEIEPPRKRVRWGEEEERALKQGVEEFGVGNWKKILERYSGFFHPTRNSVSLKDKWRNLRKKKMKKKIGLWI